MKIDDVLKQVQPFIEQTEDAMRLLVEANKNELGLDVIDFLFLKPKRIRPAFVFLCTLALGQRIDNTVIEIALALELLHNATLIHDDILDESKTRRGKESFYAKFGSKKAVIIGDYILSLCLVVLSKISRKEIFDIFSSNILKTINGEINQFSNLNKVPEIEEYLNKTAAKTANLFVIAALCVCSYFEADDKTTKALKEYAYKFGTLFQIKNDIDNFKNGFDDIKNGIFTLCSIYFKQENPTCDIMFIKDDEIRKCIQKSRFLMTEIAKDANKLLDDVNSANARKTFKNLQDTLFAEV